MQVGGLYIEPPASIEVKLLIPFLKQEVPKQIVSERADVSTDILDEHYNKMTEREKMEQRREYLEPI